MQEDGESLEEQQAGKSQAPAPAACHQSAKMTDKGECLAMIVSPLYALKEQELRAPDFYDAEPESSGLGSPAAKRDTPSSGPIQLPA